MDGPLDRTYNGHTIRETRGKRQMNATLTRRWLCEPCGEIYDPVVGDPESGIAPGTAFEDIPESWLCPVCGARKSDFVPLDD
jgi:rubredoxin